jgi:serine phosphatase RsbU (regulator of sigma subunit)
MHTPPKILIVDDVPLNVSLLEQVLEELGYQTVSATNGHAALESIAAAEPDLVLLDIMMPEMDGFEVLERLQANPAWRDLPVIVISALHDLSDVVKGIERGAADYLSKPFEPVLLQARIAALLEKKRLRDIETKYRKALERELEIGREIQASFLPTQLPHVPGWEIGARFHAQRLVAGDLYDAFVLPNAQRLCVVIGDVSGKGVGAALYMALYRTLLRVLLLQSDADELEDAAQLIQCVRLTNEYVTRTHGAAHMFASLFVALLEPARGVLTYVNAGHNPPLVLGAMHYRELARTGMVSGLVYDTPFSAAQTEIAPGETLLLYTDGVTEAFDGETQEYGQARLAEVACRPANSVHALLDCIEADVFEFMGATEQADDITLLALYRAPADARGTNSR